MELKTKQRIALSAVFFQSGLCFSSWASRIPDVKQAFDLDESGLGLLLLIKPFGAFLGLPLAGWFVDRYGSRFSVGISIICYSLCLILISVSPSVYLLVISLFAFGLSANLVNVSVNTQALAIQHQYGRVVMASFHGLWSLAGFSGAAIGALAISLNMEIPAHFTVVAIVILLLLSFCYPFLNKEKSNNSIGGFTLRMPDKPIAKLGVIAFCGMLCEGCMFDWSGVYFKEVLGAEEGMITAGFIAFMSMMGMGRLISDAFTNRWGTHTVLQVSGGLIFSGLLLAVLLPDFITGIAGFFLVGLGTSSVIPLTYSEVGRTGIAAPGTSIAMVSTIGYFGFLLGPPIIGFIADALSLRVSFGFVAIVGLGISVLTTYNKRAVARASTP